jgi:hypothetical protein
MVQSKQYDMLSGTLITAVVGGLALSSITSGRNWPDTKAWLSKLLAILKG